jgi:hypothetical protein
MYAEREARREAARRATDQLTYELIHNLVVETTRLGIEVKNLKMRVESVGSRLEFNERRARALESVVVYKPGDRDDVNDVNRRGQAPSRAHQPSPPPPQPRQQPQPPTPPAPSPQIAHPSGVNTGIAGAGQSPEGPGQRSRRRRRRRGRRGGGSAAAVMGGQAAPQPGAPESPADFSADNEADTAEEMEAGDEQAVGANERGDVDAAGTETAATVATDDLEQFSGAQAHPSEPMIRPAETHVERAGHEPPRAGDQVAPDESVAPSEHVSPGPAKPDPDTQ